MLKGEHISVVIPAQNEQDAIGLVVKDLRNLLGEDGVTPLIDCIMVCDNGSTDNTVLCAEAEGATVVSQPIPGYGIACLTALQKLPPTDIILFVDGDHSFYADQATALIGAIANGADLAIGSRTLGKQEKGALTPPQILGNALASFLIRVLWGVPVTDLGPFRAIDARALDKINMQDRQFGWTVEMQVKAAQYGFRIEEYAVDTRRRIGVSKISGTLAGSYGAAKGILGKIFVLWLQQRIASKKYSSTNI